MVISPPPWTQRLWQSWRQDVGDFLNLWKQPPTPTPGMHTFHVELPGGQKRIHLRVESTGSAVLFVDVTDVIHLNPTAAEMAYFALQGIPQRQAQIWLQRRFERQAHPQLRHELAQIYTMIARFREPELGCPTCAVDALERSPLFSRRAHAPYKADLAITYGCNNACHHCYNEADRFEMPSLNKEGWFQVLDKLHAVGVPHIIFTGGEATLNPDLPALIQYADQLGHVVGLNSNGRYLAHAPFVETLAQAGLNHVQVTLGSSRPQIHNNIMQARSFAQTVAGIRNAVASRIHVITNTTLMRCNMKHVTEIIDFLYELGIRTFAMNGMIYSGGGTADPNAIPEAELAPLLIRVRDHAAAKGMRFLWYTPTEYCRLSPVELEIGAKRCNAGEYSICIEPNGDVLPCQSFYTAAGNILHDPWSQIWHSDLFHSFRDRELDPAQTGLPEKCWDCLDLPLCGGGCRIEREVRDGVPAAAGCGSGGCGTKNIMDKGKSQLQTIALDPDTQRLSHKARPDFVGVNEVAVWKSSSTVNGNGRSGSSIRTTRFIAASHSNGQAKISQKDQGSEAGNPGGSKTPFNPPKKSNGAQNYE